MSVFAIGTNIVPDRSAGQLTKVSQYALANESNSAPLDAAVFSSLPHPSIRNMSEITEEMDWARMQDSESRPEDGLVSCRARQL